MDTTSTDSDSAYTRPNRVSITPERLLAALHPKIEKAAEAKSAAFSFVINFFFELQRREIHSDG